MNTINKYPYDCQQIPVSTGVDVSEVASGLYAYRNLIVQMLMTGLIALMLFSQPVHAKPIVYVPLGSDDNIVVIDSAVDRPVSVIRGVRAVHGLAGTPDGQFLIAGSFEENSGDAAAPAKPSAVSEDEHAAHHGGAVNAASGGETMISTVSIIRTTDGSIVRRVDVPGATHHVAMDPAGRFAVLTHPNEGSISVIDLDTYEVVATIKTGPLPNYAAFSSDGSQVYVSNAGNATVSAIDTEGWVVGWATPVGSSPEHVVLSSDGGTLYVNNVDDGTVSVVSIKDRKELKTIQVGESLHGIDLSDDGQTLFVAVLGDEQLAAFNLQTGVWKKTALGPDPYHLAAIHGTGKLYVSSASEPKIWVISQQDLRILGEISIGGKGHQIVLGADG